MSLVTQIGGAELQTTNQFATLLERLGIQVSEPIGQAWSDVGDSKFPAAHYETSLRMFRSIATSSFHIVDNEASSLDEATCLQVLYAMRNNKPVIFTQVPSLSQSVALGIRNIIRARMGKFFTIDLKNNDADSLGALFDDLPTIVNYDLTSEELKTIKYETKTHFRTLLK